MSLPESSSMLQWYLLSVTLWSIDEKELLSRLQAMQKGKLWKDWCHTAASCSTQIDIDQWDDERRPAVSLYLNELLD